LENNNLFLLQINAKIGNVKHNERSTHPTTTKMQIDEETTLSSQQSHLNINAILQGRTKK